jgi:hypothetical protein
MIRLRYARAAMSAICYSLRGSVSYFSIASSRRQALNSAPSITSFLLAAGSHRTKRKHNVSSSRRSSMTRGKCEGGGCNSHSGRGSSRPGLDSPGATPARGLWSKNAEGTKIIIDSAINLEVRRADRVTGINAFLPLLMVQGAPVALRC